jgi:rhamnosyl/mannosyltransferase
MRVLHVYKSYFPDSQGGLEEVIRQISRTSQPFGVEPRVFTLSPSAEPAPIHREEAVVHRFPRTLQLASCDLSLGAWRGFRQLAAWADIIHYHYPWPMGDLLHLAVRPKRPSVVTYHSDIVRQKRLLPFYLPIRNRFLAAVDTIVATSPNYFASSTVLSQHASKVEIIPIGLDETSFPQPGPERIEAMRRAAGEGFFLFVGVLRYYKGLHILLEAVQGTALPVVIVGSGPVETELKRRAKALNLTNVRFLGAVDETDKLALFRLARAVVFPSYLRSEAYGVTLVEGAMQGRPLISTEIGTGTSFVNRDGESGLVVPPADPKHLREAMERLAHDPELAEALGAGARQRYETLFSGEVMGARYARLYHQLAGSPSE